MVVEVVAKQVLMAAVETVAVVVGAAEVALAQAVLQ
jgi:hypothetical protein